MVARLESGHVTSDGFDDACNLVTENCGSGEWEIAVQVVEIAMADAGSCHSNQYLVVRWQVDDNVLDAHPRPRLKKDSCFHLLRILKQFS